MKAEDKQTVMQQFKDNELQLLIPTTVIEVGVDVPNASLMIIENAERLGLSHYTSYADELDVVLSPVFACCCIKPHYRKMDMSACRF